MIKLNDIELFFKNYDFNDQEIQLSPCETITDLRTFVNSHFRVLQNNKGNKVILPYFNRLKKVYLKLKIK